MKLYRNCIINEVARAGEHTNERTYVLTYIRTGQTLYPLHNFVVRGDKKHTLYICTKCIEKVQCFILKNTDVNAVISCTTSISFQKKLDNVEEMEKETSFNATISEFANYINPLIQKDIVGVRVVRWCWVNFQCRGVLQF